MRSERERLLDILEAIERIDKYAEEGNRLLKQMNLYKSG